MILLEILKTETELKPFFIMKARTSLREPLKMLLHLGPSLRVNLVSQAQEPGFPSGNTR